jgi:hypothetical protein
MAPGVDSISHNNQVTKVGTSMLIECKRGPTTQTIGRATYHFETDGAGRAVCEVGYDHLHVFLARPEVYAIADPAAEWQLSIVVHPIGEAGGSPAAHERHSGAADGMIRPRPKRGRPRKDDSVALAEMRMLTETGIGLNSAAAGVAARLASGNSRDQDSVRKRLLRKHKDGQSR